MCIAVPAMKNDGGWQGYWQYTAATGVIVLILITIMVSRPDYDGLFQRLLVIIIRLWWGYWRALGTGRTGARLSSIAILFPLPIHLSGMPGMVYRCLFFIPSLTIIILACTAMSGCLQADSPTGTLTGNVSIGPLCPVEPCSVSYDRLVAAYAVRPITISTSAGSVVTTVIADPETGYAVALKPGTYVIDIPHQGIGGSRELPATVTIRSNEMVRLDISIDTGIR